MTTKQLEHALRAHKERRAREEAAAHIERKLMPGYPTSHNPYLPHKPVPDCYAGCVRMP